MWLLVSPPWSAGLPSIVTRHSACRLCHFLFPRCHIEMRMLLPSRSTNYFASCGILIYKNQSRGFLNWWMKSLPFSCVVQTLLLCSRVVSETCPTPVSCVFLRIYHVFTCRVYFNIAVPVQRSFRILFRKNLCRLRICNVLRSTMCCHSSNYKRLLKSTCRWYCQRHLIGIKRWQLQESCLIVFSFLIYQFILRYCYQNIIKTLFRQQTWQLSGLLAGRSSGLFKGEKRLRKLNKNVKLKYETSELPRKMERIENPRKVHRGRWENKVS